MSNVAVPMTILTGFLGAGKTTLLNRILNGDHGLRVAVLVNDFGAINIDADLIIGVKDDVVSLANGCVCCTIREDLAQTVVEVIGRPEAPEYILLEASGVADPSGIALTFLSDALRDRIRLDSVTCVVDADQVFAHSENPAVMELKLRQIAFADMMVLNKVDLAGPAGVSRVRAWVDEHFNRLRIVETNHCDVPLEILLSVGRFDPALNGQNGHPGEMCHGASHHHAHDHSDSFSTWSFETDQPISLERLREALRKLPGDIYRAKGLLFSSEDRIRDAVLQVVGRRVDICAGEPWNDRTPRTRVVVIGAPGGVEPRSLQALFEGCLDYGVQTRTPGR